MEDTSNFESKEGMFISDSENVIKKIHRLKLKSSHEKRKVRTFIDNFLT